MKCAVIGLGEFGQAAALGLASNGVEVIAADINMDRVNGLKDRVAMAVRLDASQEDAMRAHGMADVDVLIAAIGANFESQVLVVVHAREFGIKHIVARASSADHRRVLSAVGAHHVFNPEEEAARWMVQRLLITDISSYFELADGFSMVEVNAPRRVVGQTLEQLRLRRRFRINLVAIKRMEVSPTGEKVLKQFNPVPSPEEVIQPDDVLAMVGSVVDLANFMGEYSS
jgi:trk system potassium uptake protein TrkA